MKISDKTLVIRTKLGKTFSMSLDVSDDNSILTQAVATVQQHAHKPKENMQIIVKDQVCHLITVTPSDSIEELKGKIEELLGLPLEEQRLIFRAQQLENSHTLSYYNVQDMSTISLVLKLRGS